MARFECPVVQVTIEEHPNADAIEIARVAGFQSIVRKGVYRSGDLAIYLPEGSVLPEALLRGQGFWDEAKGKGTLKGKLGNRITAVKLRGVLSQGVVVPFSALPAGYGALPPLGTDCAAMLGVTKYVPELSVQFNGTIAGTLVGYTVRFDVENIKKEPEAFQPDEPVVITEKLHGASCFVGVVDEELEFENRHHLYKDKVYVSTKNFSNQGILMSPLDIKNIHARTVMNDHVCDDVLAIHYIVQSQMKRMDPSSPLYGRKIVSTVLGGEIVGVQDLKYGLKPGETAFYAWDLWVIDDKGEQHAVHWDFLTEMQANLDFKIVPAGRYGDFGHPRYVTHLENLEDFSPAGLAELARGKSRLDPEQIREGVVIRTFNPLMQGYRTYKSVSEDYLLRKGDTTEYE